MVLFHENRYDIIGQWLLTPGTKVVLGDSTTRKCRFCDRAEPEVSFKGVAHAIPESLGNKTIESMYECDDCNSLFGRGIENANPREVWRAESCKRRSERSSYRLRPAKWL
ncbi:HNH endonuclease [Agrobacterium tumefaciens]|uniref:HNH endonuclease n=1 Tax=Agrobacterium tumefaciens TaxID=358 RepID=UPI00396A0C71